MSALLVLSTTSDVSEAKKIARALVKKHLAACVNILPKIDSHYRWKGKIHSEQEVLMLIKTTGSRLDALTKCIQALHSYDVPEVIALPIVGGSTTYLRWIQTTLNRTSGSRNIGKARPSSHASAWDGPSR